MAGTNSPPSHSFSKGSSKTSSHSSPRFYTRTTSIKSRSNLLFEKQKDYLEEIGVKLSKLPDDITELQELLKPLLNNIFINDENYVKIQSATTFNIADTTKESNIYTIPADQEKLDVEKYQEFLKFMIQSLHTNNTEFSTDSGDIITAYCISGDKDDKDEFEKITERYKTIYMGYNKLLPDKSKNKALQKNKYPYWKEYLLITSKSVLYEETEKKLGIKKILEQNDTEFLETINKRTNGLHMCAKTETNTNTQKFYNTEFTKTTKKNNNIDNTNLNTPKHKPKSDKEKIETLCKNTIWGIKDYEYSQKKKEELEIEFQDFKKFIETTHNELIFMKTFIPPKYFIDNDTLNWESIKNLMLSRNKNFKQYVFGYTEDIEHYSKYKTFFELLNMDFNNTDTETCNLLVLWNMVSNLYFNRCAISNTQIPFSIRFILPKKKFNFYNPKTNIFTIKKTIPINPFIENQDYNLDFIGFINIKYYHEQSQTFRNWILLLFKNDNLVNESLLDYFKGNIPKIIFLDYKFEYVNNGGLLSRHAVTYEELGDFIKRNDKNEITLYQSMLGDKSTLFISPNNYNLLTLKHLDNLKLTKIKLKKLIDYKFEILYNDSSNNKPTHITNSVQLTNISGGNMSKGNINIEHIKLEFSNNIINLYDDTLTTTKTYSEYFKNCNLINNYYDKEVHECYKRLYNYLLISSDEIQYSFLNTLKYEKKYHIPKYIPLSNKFYSLYEVLNKYNILNNCNKNDNILNIGYNMVALEMLHQQNYKFNNINCIIPSNSDNYYKYVLSEWKQHLITLTSIYNVKLKFYTDLIYNLLNESLNKNKLVIYTVYSMDKDLYNYENFLNTNNIFLGMLIGLKFTDNNGDFILHFGSVAYKHIADIYFILKKYFKNSNLYYPEISNQSKKTGVYGVFLGFKGISEDEYTYLSDIFNKIKNPDVYLTNLLEKLKHSRDSEVKYISGFLNNQNYNEVIDFNNSIYISKLLFVQKVLNLLQNKNYKSLKIPTKEQIISSILYCRKYEIPIFDKYSITSQNSIITKTILHDMYGLHEPIIYKFKTPFSTHIANKIIFNPKFKSTSKTNSTYKQYTSLLKTETKTISHLKPKSKSKSKSISHLKSKLKPKSKSKLKSKLNSHSLFNSLFSNSTIHKSSKHKSHSTKHKLSKHKSSTNKLKSTKKHSHFKHSNMSLEESIFNSNNQLIQAGRLMDVRKDFSKKYPNELYYNLQNQLRFYQGEKGDGKNKPGDNDRNIGNLDIKVQRHLGDFSISQAWLKMYEIITDCNLIPTNRKGIYKSFHICEAPGTFINCINNYIHTKTNYDSFEWKAQSLKPNGARSKANTIGDTYKLIKRHPNKWDWGVDGTGDITNIDNIKHYAKIAKNMNVNLMTSDCGLPMGDPKYYQVAYASYVSILYSLPHNGTLLYKIHNPIDTPLIWNLIYITYTNFREMYFFKPVQNSQSREFYIIGKGYLGTDQKVLDKLLYLVQDFEDPKFNKEEYDLFNDIYPEEFVIQIQHICEKLTTNFVNSIEKIIYYVDNIDALGKEYKKHIESYMEEKNDDWVRKYKPKRLEKKFIL